MTQMCICIFLDEVETDFASVWEIVYVLAAKEEKEIKDVAFLIEVAKIISFCIENSFVNLYEGKTFAGEEKIVNHLVIDWKFLLINSEDWKSKKEGDYCLKLYITDIGRKYFYSNCGNAIN